MSRNKKQANDNGDSLPVGLGGVIMLVGGLLLLCSASTFSPSDLPIGPMKFLGDLAGSQEPILPRQNMFGILGTLVGLLQLQLLGGAAFFLSAGLIILGLLRLIYKRREPLMVLIGFGGIVVFAAAYMSCPGVGLEHWAKVNVFAGPGGIVGEILGTYIFKTILSAGGASVVFVVGYLASMCYFVGSTPLKVLYGTMDLLKRSFVTIQGQASALAPTAVKRTSLADSSHIPPLPTSLFDDEEVKKDTSGKKRATRKKASARAVTPPEESASAAEPVFTREEEPQIIDGATKRFTAEEVLNKKPFEKKETEGYKGLTVDGFDDYELPGFDLLDYDTEAPPSDTNRDELLGIQRTIIETLKSFGLDVTAGDITRGPTITRFEVYPAIGLKVSRIVALEADLARVTKAEAINILAPIPGKDTVGIEVANENRVLVPFSEILMDDAFRSSKRKIPLALGKNVYGEAVIGDLAAMPHCLIAGATGAGKSVCINTVICSILYKFSPDELRFIMVDPKVVEMQVYSKLPHLVVPVITDPNKVVGALKWSVNEMERRYKLFAKCGVRNFDSFNDRARPESEAPAESTTPEEEIDEPVDMAQIEAIASAFEDGDLGPEAPVDEDLAGFPDEVDEDEIPDRLPYIVIIIDELADLMQTAPADVELCIARIAQKARAAGMHLIVATQTPRADVVTGIIKANIPSRISFQVSSKIDSRVILDQGGAEKLIGKGDMLFLPPGSAKLERSQGAFVSDEEVDKIVGFCSEQAEQKFEESIQNTIDSGGDESSGGDDVSDADEELMKQCLEVVIQEGKASTSLLQRRLRLGYTRAARIIDIMEQRGYVGPADGARPREVFVGS